MARTPLDEIPESGTVVVGCKYPGGILCDEEVPYEVEEQFIGGINKTVTQYRRTGRRILLNGPSVPLNAQGMPEWPKHRITSGFGVTEGVPAAMFKQWYERHKDADYVKNGLVFFMRSEQDVINEARNREGMKTGLEPLDPHNLPREFRRDGLETAKV